MAVGGWYVRNGLRAYPFVKGSVGRSTGSASVGRLPDRVVVDAGFVLGPRSAFDSVAHTVYLARVRRQGDVFLFDFESDAPELFGVTLTFSRHHDDPDYETEFADSGAAGISDASLSYSGTACDEPLLTGFLVTGRVSDLAALLPANGTIERAEVGDGRVEPALLQNLAGAYVTKLGVANDDRTRVTSPVGCAGISWPYAIGQVHTDSTCLLGEVQFKAGYNAQVRQSVFDNALTFAAVIGAGEGEPCTEVPVFDGESAPTGSELLNGGPRCADVIRSVNGRGGPLLAFLAGTGVTVTPDPDGNTVTVDVDMTGLANCYGLSQASESC